VDIEIFEMIRGAISDARNSRPILRIESPFSCRQPELIASRFGHGVCPQERNRCQALFDEAAFLTCMSHVDMNPIRAGIADSPDSSLHSSAQRRIATLREDPARAKRPPGSINTTATPDRLPINTGDDLDLVDWSARLARGDKRGHIDAMEPPVLRKLGLSERQWLQQLLGVEMNYWRAMSLPRPSSKSGRDEAGMAKGDRKRPAAATT
jgi:hypothetical protein